MNQLFVPSSDPLHRACPEALWRFRRVLDGSSYRLKTLRKLFGNGVFWGLKLVFKFHSPIWLSKSKIQPEALLEIIQGRLLDDSEAYAAIKSAGKAYRPRMGMENLSILSLLNKKDVIWDPNMYTMFEKNIKGYVRPVAPIPELDPTCIPFVPCKDDNRVLFIKSDLCYDPDPVHTPLAPDGSSNIGASTHIIRFPMSKSGPSGSKCAKWSVSPPCTSKDYVSGCVTCLDCDLTFDLFKMKVCVEDEPGVVLINRVPTLDCTKFFICPGLTSDMRVNGDKYRRRLLPTSEAVAHSKCIMWKLYLYGNVERVLPIPRNFKVSATSILEAFFGKEVCKKYDRLI